MRRIIKTGYVLLKQSVLRELRTMEGGIMTRKGKTQELWRIVEISISEGLGHQNNYERSPARVL